MKVGRVVAREVERVANGEMNGMATYAILNDGELVLVGFRGYMRDGNVMVRRLFMDHAPKGEVVVVEDGRVLPESDATIRRIKAGYMLVSGPLRVMGRSIGRLNRKLQRALNRGAAAPRGWGSIEGGLEVTHG